MLLPGHDLLEQYNFSSATRYYDIAAVITPSYNSYYGAAVCALVNGDFQRCIDLLRALPYSTSEKNYYLGVAYFQTKDFPAALLHFNKIKASCPYAWHAQYYKGIIKLKNGNVEAAMTLLDETPTSFDKEWLVAYIEDYKKLIKARDHYENGLYSSAIDIYKQVEFFHNYRNVGRALVYYKLNDYQRCILLCDSVIAQSSDSTLVAQALFFAGATSILTSQSEKARNYLKKYIEIEKDNEAYFLIGRTFSDEIRYDSARIYFSDLPDSVDKYLFFKGRTDYFLGQWGSAEDILLRHREFFPGSRYGDRATYILASINFRRKEYEQAVDFWKELVTLFPKSIYAASAQKGIGNAYYALGSYKKALDAYYAVEQYDPSPTVSAEAALSAYETRFKLGEYRSLISALQHFIEEHSDSRLAARTRLRIASLFIGEREYYQGIVELDKLIDRYPDSSIVGDALVEKAKIYRLLDNKKQEKRTYHYLITLTHIKSHHPFAYNELGMLYFNEMNYDSTLYYYNQLLDDIRYRERALYEITRVYNKLGQIKEAETMINKLIAEYPSSAFLLDAYLLRNEVYRRAGEYDKALRVLKNLIQEMGDRAELYSAVGDIYFEIEDYVRARENYLIACKFFGQQRNDAARVLISAGNASVAIGDSKSALEYYLQASLIAESLILKNQANEKMSAISE